jgi:hypothetical protein
LVKEKIKIKEGNKSHEDLQNELDHIETAIENLVEEFEGSDDNNLDLDEEE